VSANRATLRHGVERAVNTSVRSSGRNRLGRAPVECSRIDHEIVNSLFCQDHLLNVFVHQMAEFRERLVVIADLDKRLNHHFELFLGVGVWLLLILDLQIHLSAYNHTLLLVNTLRDRAVHLTSMSRLVVVVSNQLFP
jgi:hypothetical protein